MHSTWTGSSLDNNGAQEVRCKEDMEEEEDREEGGMAMDMEVDMEVGEEDTMEVVEAGMGEVEVAKEGVMEVDMVDTEEDMVVVEDTMDMEGVEVVKRDKEAREVEVVGRGGQDRCRGAQTTMAVIIVRRTRNGGNIQA